MRNYPSWLFIVIMAFTLGLAGPNDAGAMSQIQLI